EWACPSRQNRPCGRRGPRANRKGGCGWPSPSFVPSRAENRTESASSKRCEHTICYEPWPRLPGGFARKGSFEYHANRPWPDPRSFMLEFCTLLMTLLPAKDPFPYAEAEAELSEEITERELRAHVYRLASPEFLGRNGPGAAPAARHLEAAFKKLKLQPAFGDSYFQPIPAMGAGGKPDRESFVGRNVAAVLPGIDPELKEEWILLSAHYDHLGVKKGRLHPGADDNATGVAMLLEVAERFALQKNKPRRTMMFVAFDQEETG